MSSRIALATLALGTALLALPAFAQTYGGSDNSAQQYKYPIGRSADEGGSNYGPQNTTNNGPQTGLAVNRQTRRTSVNRGAYRLARGGYGQGYAGAPGDQDYYNYYTGGPGYLEAASPAPDAAAWCAARFRSFDPATGTYLGFDGVRHSCP